MFVLVRDSVDYLIETHLMKRDLCSFTNKYDSVNVFVVIVFRRLFVCRSGFYDKIAFENDGKCHAHG